MKPKCGHCKHYKYIDDFGYCEFLEVDTSFDLLRCGEDDYQVND